MSQVVRRPMSLGEFLAWEREQDERYEFDGVGPVAMTGGKMAHRVLADNLTRLLNDAIGRRGCLAMAGDVKILAAGRVRDPDVVVTCATIDLADEIVPDPVIVVEVLSASTAETDRYHKLEDYRRTVTIQHYLLLEQDIAKSILYSRESGEWRVEVVDMSGGIRFSALEITIPLVNVYHRVISPG